VRRSKWGLVESLTRPGGNVTGLSNLEAELGGKRLDLLREVIPGLARVAILAAKTDPFTASFVQNLQTGAARLGPSSIRCWSTTRASSKMRSRPCVRLAIKRS
jgi:ABC-type uncharacterized transport system substrate-binding protein